MLCVQHGWELSSLDVSVAFLKGYTFKELADRGIKRPPVAFVPPKEAWELLKEIDPANFSKVFGGSTDEWVFCLEKAAYGLRDAPLMWHLRAISVLKANHYHAYKHDSCSFYLLDANKNLKCFLTLHVDDLLATAELSTLKELQDVLSKEFGPLTLDLTKFKHFGVDLEKFPDGHIEASQKRYLSDLKDVAMPKRSCKTDKIPKEMITDYRATVSAMAWLGVTSPHALVSASLLQGCLPEPTFDDVHKLNTNLQQLRETYQPLQYRKINGPLRLVMIGDSSFANSDKYSQGGYILFLTAADDNSLCNAFMILDFKSNKSKRVATSTMHAEALAKLFGLEGALFVQSYLAEIAAPQTSTLDLLEPEKLPELIELVSATDCEDLYAVLTAPAQPSTGNKHLGLYIAALREFKEVGRIRAWIWLDTRDCLANILTKLMPNGEVMQDGFDLILKKFVWQPQHPYKWNGQYCTDM